jgi:hypothetical protein
MKKIGKKTAEWLTEKPKLVKIYKAKGITRCEISGSRFLISFHHISKRSGQEAEHTFEGTRLLNQEWHDFCEYNKEANKLLIVKPRGFDRDYFERFKAMKKEKGKNNTKKSDWQTPHACKKCKKIVSLLVCNYCGEISI